MTNKEMSELLAVVLDQLTYITALLNTEQMILKTEEGNDNERH